MDTLKNLREIYKIANSRFSQYEGKDFILPEIFKSQVKEINSYKISYNRYSAVIKTRENPSESLSIYLPNQWFYVASYFTDFYNELQKYKKYALKVISKERLKVLNGSELTDSEKNAIKQLNIDEQSQDYLVKFITDYSWWSGAKTIDRGDFFVSPILNSARLVNASQSFVADLCAFLADKDDLVKAIIEGEKKSSKLNSNSSKITSLQQIFYGAPGTGKSHKIKEDERVKTADGKQLVFRTTFHPDSDYSTFVGAYKPTMKPVADRYKAVAGKDEEITYSFVAQTFLQAYVAAWNNIDEHVFLVIEEINRGNCAQIFGDLFQLLDRDENGFSEYPIIADKDLKKYLNGKDEDGEDVLTNKKGIENGKLCLPSNLHIWATMNTSDQSLFPIDSAFKRRWEWKYMPIANERKGWEIKIDVNKYDWWEFLEIINKKIEDTTYSEDKKLGYFFCKAQNGVIDDKKFVGKVLFYLWNDVFKDTDLADSLFTDEDGKKSFDKFYIPLGEGETKVDTARVIAFMEKLEIEPKSEGEIEEELEEEEDGGVLYVIDSGTFKRKSYAGKEIMMQYLKKHPELTFQEIKEAFPDSMLGRITYGGVIAAEGADLGSYIRYYSPEQFTSSDGVNFRIFKQWTKVNMQNIINFGNTHGIDVEVKER